MHRRALWVLERPEPFPCPSPPRLLGRQPRGPLLGPGLRELSDGRGDRAGREQPTSGRPLSCLLANFGWEHGSAIGRPAATHSSGRALCQQGWHWAVVEAELGGWRRERWEVQMPPPSKPGKLRQGGQANAAIPPCSSPSSAPPPALLKCTVQLWIPPPPRLRASRRLLHHFSLLAFTGIGTWFYFSLLAAEKAPSLWLRRFAPFDGFSRRGS